MGEKSILVVVQYMSGHVTFQIYKILHFLSGILRGIIIDYFSVMWKGVVPPLPLSPRGAFDAFFQCYLRYLGGQHRLPPVWQSGRHFFFRLPLWLRFYNSRYSIKTQVKTNDVGAFGPGSCLEFQGGSRGDNQLAWRGCCIFAKFCQDM